MNWALIGYGTMGKWHVDQLRTLDDIRILGVYDILEERQAEAREKGLRTYGSLHEVLADAAVELVTIATSNDCHRSIAEAVMKAGKHVIVEKPVTMSVGDLQSMIDVSREAGRLFTVHQNRRWDEDFLAVKNIVREHMLGRVFNIESRVHGSRGISGWRCMQRYGGGILLDWGVHLFDQMLQLIEEPVVSAYCACTYVTTAEVDDGFKSVITFGSGVTAHVEVGTSNFIHLPRWYVQGEHGSAIVHDWDMNGEIVKVSNWEKCDAVPVITAAGVTKTMAPRTEETIRRHPLPTVTSDVRDFYRNMLRAARGEEEQIVTHPQMMRVMRLIEAMFESSARNEIVHTRI